MLRRRIHNIHSNRRMNTFKEIQGNDLLYSVPHLPDLVNNHIESYLTETPLSSRINTRINNRTNPGIPSSAVPRTIANRRAYEIEFFHDMMIAKKTKKTKKTKKMKKMKKAKKKDTGTDTDTDTDEDTDTDTDEDVKIWR